MGDLGPSLAAWLLLPVVLYVVALGLGLLAERATRFTLPNALLAPVGVCMAIALVMPGYRLEVGAWFAVTLVLLGALAGLVLARRELRERLNPGWAGVAGLSVYALYIAPVVLAGGWTWTGYNFVNDTAVQFLLADHLAEHGAAMPASPGSEPVSSGLEHVRIYLITAYPLGIHALLATLDPLVPAPLAAIYQPVIAAFAALAAMALVPLGRRSGLPAPAAAAAAVAALAASLAFNYALQGNAKETAMLATIAVAAAVGREALTSERAVGGVAVVALCLSASIALFSAAAVPYVGAFGLAMLAAAFVQRDSQLRRRMLPALVVGAGVLAAASLSTLVKIVRFGEVASGTFGENASAATDDMGHLLRPLRLAQTAGVWLVDDYRLPVPDGRQPLNTLLILVVAAALLGGVAWLLRRRETGALLWLAPVALTVAVVAPRVSPYAAAKTFAIASPAIVFVAAIGAFALWTSARAAGPRLPRLAVRAGPIAAGLAALAISGGVLVSDLFAYRAVQLAPIDRMSSLERLGERYAGRGLVLVDDFEEFAKYFMGDSRVNVALENITPVPARATLLRSFIPFHADVDQMPLEYLSRFGVIVQRRGADSSRPPANWERDYEDRYYTAWVPRGDARVTRHLPLQSLYNGSEPAPCDQVEALAGPAADGEMLVAAEPPERVRLDPLVAGSPWSPDPNRPGAVRAATPGTVGADLRFQGGRYRAWVLGSFGRDLAVRVDGRRVGVASGVNTTGEWLDAGEARIDAGSHRVEIVRGGAGPGPGNRYVGWLGPVVLERIDRAERLEWLLPSQARRLCGRELDWVELARPSCPVRGRCERG